MCQLAAARWQQHVFVGEHRVLLLHAKLYHHVVLPPSDAPPPPPPHVDLIRGPFWAYAWGIITRGTGQVGAGLGRMCNRRHAQSQGKWVKSWPCWYRDGWARASLQLFWIVSCQAHFGGGCMLGSHARTEKLDLCSTSLRRPCPGVKPPIYFSCTLLFWACVWGAQPRCRCIAYMLLLPPLLVPARASAAALFSVLLGPFQGLLAAFWFQGWAGAPTLMWHWTPYARACPALSRGRGLLERMPGLLCGLWAGKHFFCNWLMNPGGDSRHTPLLHLRACAASPSPVPLQGHACMAATG